MMFSWGKWPTFLCWITLFLITGLRAENAAPTPRTEALILLAEATKLPPKEAVAYSRKAYELLVSSENPDPTEVAICAAATARAHSALGNEDEALFWYKRATAEPSARAELADILLKQGKLAAAQEALLPPANTPQWNQTQGKIHLAQGDAFAARRCFLLALIDLDSSELLSRQSLLIDLAGAHVRADDWPAARESLAEAAALFSEVDHHPSVISAFATLSASDPDLTATEQNSLLTEAVGLLSPFEDFLNSPSSTSLQVALASSHAELDQSADVLKISEKLLPTLPEVHPLRSQILALIAWAAEDPEKAQLASQEASEWILSRSLDPVSAAGTIARTVDPISPLMPWLTEPKVLDQLCQILWEHQNVALRNWLGQPLPPRPTTGTHVLYFTYDAPWPSRREHLAALVYSNGSRRIVELGPSEKVYRRIQSVIATAESTLTGQTTSTASFDTRLTALYKLIWAPLNLGSCHQVTLYPDSFLRFVPWAALRSKKGAYLADGSLLDIHPYPRTSRSFSSEIEGLAIGFTEAPAAGLPPLPAVRTELLALPLPRELNPKSETFSKLVTHRKTLHISGHGQLLPTGESAICLPDRSIPAGEIVNLDLSASTLVTLSLCRGGLGTAETGGNISSLQRAFLAAGARHCIAARWQVRDDLTAAFMADFYANLAVQPNPSRALQLTQKDWFAMATPEKIATAAAWICE